ncbi:MAG TPA: tRNA lysidine(34) synthetase TilS [Dehalococcoidia bacterium]|nr:tRNA lysidine(34) synthetase TilS [Dehalococcoidia bacterium]
MAQPAVQGHAQSKPRRPFARALENRVRRFVERHGALRPGEHVLLAVSGGGDSTSMMLILSRLVAESGWRLAIAHFDHRLRGSDAAAADLEFVSGLASSLGLPFVHGAGDVSRRARSRGESVEQAARVLRYRFLARQAKALGASVVATGHTLDDQAETVLLHLVRGSGLGGLAGMRPRSGWPLGTGPEVARPLLALRREETARYCREMGVVPREDATNELLLAARNRVRHEVLPALRALNPRVDTALSRLADAAHEDAAALEAQATEALARLARPRAGHVTLDLETLRALPPAVRARVLRLALAGVMGSDVDIESVHVEALNRLVTSRPGGASLAHGVVAVRDSRSLTLRRGEPQVALELPETRLAVPGVTEVGGWRFETEFTAGRRTREAALVAELDPGLAADGLWVRSRRPGDRMRPVGLGGTKKLQDIMVDAKLPRGERDGVPLIITKLGIVWAVGLCLDEGAVARLGASEVLRVRGRRLKAEGHPRH